MDLKLKNVQIFNAILLMVIQNNIALKSLVKTMDQYLAKKEGDEAADKLLLRYYELTDKTQDEVMAQLMSEFGEKPTINGQDWNDFLKNISPEK